MSINLRIDELNGGMIERVGKLDTSWCDGDLARIYQPKTDELIVDFRAVQTASIVAVEARLQAAFRFRCSRCVAPAEFEIDTRFSHHFVVPGSLEVTASPEQSDELTMDPDISEHDGTQIELQSLCIEHAILALPSNPLCADSCKGLCSRCGTNLNQTACECSATADEWSPWSALSKMKIEPAS